jgi:hypothetical protein
MSLMALSWKRDDRYSVRAETKGEPAIRGNCPDRSDAARDEKLDLYG